MNLAKRIYDLQCFQDSLNQIIQKSVKDIFPSVQSNQTLNLEKVDWNYLLSCASALAHSSDPDCQDAALRIAQCCLVDPDTSEDQNIAASIVFHKLTNKPAIDLAIEKKYLREDYSSKIPLPLAIENTKRDVEYTIFNKNEKEIYLNKFQKEFYEKARTLDHLSASAPTSSGKSFILNTFVFEQLMGNGVKNIVYIVPTRALINQVEQDFSEELLENDINNVYLSSVPQLAENYPVNESALFIFTQERLHWFLNENPDYKIDFLIIDEAHKINDGGRGILLQQKIEELVALFPNIKILFCSPFSKNPEVLLQGLPVNSKTGSMIAEYVAVNQNLIWVSKTKGTPREWSVSMCLKDKSLPLGKLEFEDILSETKKLPVFAYNLGSPDGGNMIYVNGQSDAENTSLELYDLVGEKLSSVGDAEIQELIALTKKIIHPQYSLAKVLERKIAFHYGNMPLVIRKEIERLYSEGHIRYLVCTSTLLEGVNLPARSIFIRKPKRGSKNKKQMTEADFWNLAGRAGRLKKEFQGNIICIDPEEWENKPIREKSKFFIKRAITEISENKEGLLEYIKQDTPRGSANDKFEYAFSYYFNKFLRNGNLQGEPLDAEYIKDLESECSRVREKIELPNDVIFRNPGISPLAQQDLLNYFKEYAEDTSKDIKNLIPTLPDAEDSAKNHYIHIIGRISKKLSSESSKLSYYHAILVVSWMRGFPLARIINNNAKYWKDERNLAQVIRETMTDIEEYVRFKFAKYSGCYIDILKFFLNSSHPDLLKDIPELNIWVEFGVSQRTQISLINLGFSRHTAIELSSYMHDRNLNTQESAKWLVENEISILELPEAVKKEVSKIKQNIIRKQLL